MRRIAVIGSGYVGLVTGTCFAELGNTVRFIDKDRAKIASLRAGAVPFYEPGLSELVTRNAERGRLSFHHAMREGLRGSEIVIIAVGTPLGEDGHADVRQVREAAKAIAEHIDGHKIVVNKSTVPVETGDLVAAIIREHNSTRFEVRVVSNPEFLREGSAIADFMRPDRVVIGSDDETALEAMRALYAPLGAPIIETDVRTAEMIKYTANAFLATKISFINEIANICERVGADVLDVVTGVGSDKRIGTAFMSAGIGFGGSCLPKDVKALACIAAQYGVAPAVLQAVLDVNAGQIERTLAALEEDLGELRGKRIGLLGLAFKPNTDDVRDSQAVALATALAQRGAIVRAHDPVATQTARAALGEAIAYAPDALDAAVGADALVVATDWSEYKQMDFAGIRSVMAGDLILDGRNIYDPVEMARYGFRYVGFGRGRRGGETERALAAS